MVFHFQEKCIPTWEMRNDAGAVVCRVTAPGWPDPVFYLDSMLPEIESRPLNAFTPEEALLEAGGIMQGARKAVPRCFGVWISTQDALPVKSSRYLICAGDRDYQYPAVAYYDTSKNRWDAAQGHAIFVDVTHWMLLPNPPGKGEP